MILKLTLKNEEERTLDLYDNEWQFFVRSGNRNDTDNMLIISNTLYNMNNSQYIIDFFNSVKNIPYADILNVQLLYSEDTNIVIFDSASLNFYYNHMYVEYKYNSDRVQEGMQDRGFIYGFVFRSTGENTEEELEE